MQTFSGTTVSHTIPLTYHVRMTVTREYAALTLDLHAPRTTMGAVIGAEERDRLGWLLAHTFDLPLDSTRWYEGRDGSIGYLRAPRRGAADAPRIEDVLRRWRDSHKPK